MIIYATPGESGQTVDYRPDARVPDHCVRMAHERPDGDGWVAGANGVWINKQQTLTPDERAGELLLAINQLVDTELHPLTVGWSDTEIQSWPEQEREARLWQAWHDGGETDTEPATPLIDAILTTEAGVDDKPGLVGKILHHADRFARQSGRAFGIRRNLVSEIQAVLDDPRLTDDQKIQRLEEIDITSPFATLLDHDAVSP